MASISCSPQLRAPFSSLRKSAPLFHSSPTSLRIQPRHFQCRIRAASAASGAPSEDNPYLTLGVSALEKFEVIKASYGRRRKEAEARGDEALVERLDKAYDRIMMMQLSNRRKGIAFGGLGVSKEIKYADKRSLIPWGPKKAPSEKNDVLINLGISVLFTAWNVFLRQAEWKPLQFMIFGYIFRVFMKLKEYEAPVAAPVYSEEEGEEGGGRDESGARLANGKRLLRTLGLVFSCVGFASLAYTGTLNAFELAGQYIPRALMGAQELFVTALTAVSLFVMASFYR